MFTTLTSDYAKTRHANAICCADRRAQTAAALKDRLRRLRARCC